MSTPVERYRSVVEGRNLLVAVASDPCVQADQRSQAQALLGEYPKPWRLCDWIVAGATELPSSVAMAIYGTSVLLHALRFREPADENLARHVVGVLRHYPLVPIAERLADHVFSGGNLGDYLAPD
jgi:hypothetical protein